MTLQEKIVEALALLNPADDAHWTSDGAPRVEVVKELVGEPTLQRQHLIQAAPEFTRDSAAKVLATEGADTSTVVQEFEDEDERVKRLLAEQQELEHEMAKGREHINACTRELTRLQEKHDAITSQLAKDGPANHIKNQENIMQYLAAQHAQRVARAQSRQALLGKLNGINPDPRTPLDQAFARKNTRGAQRPVSQMQKANGAT